jgi:hypothetical protein
LAVKKEVAQKFDVERFTFMKLIELKVRRQYQINISERFAALQNFSASEDINRAWEIIKNINRAWEIIKDIIKIRLKRV